MDLTGWDLTITGREGTIWEGSVIRFSIVFPDGNFFAGPIVKCLDNIKHIHIYEKDNIVCLGLTNKETWVADTEIYLIPIEIEDLIHREPNLNSPANTPLSLLYQKDIEKYNEFIREQIKNLSKNEENKTETLGHAQIKTEKVGA
jgi:ubiquitin-protein ligase